MGKNKLETAKRLAKAHFDVEPRLVRINLLEPLNDQDANDPIKLLEVLEGAMELGILPVGFPPDPERGIEYPTLVIEVSPKEYKAISEGRLGFGNRGWMMGEELSRHPDGALS